MRAWIGVHDTIFRDPEALTSFIATRLVPRLFTAENHALLSGPYRILNMPGFAMPDLTEQYRQAQLLRRAFDLAALSICAFSTPCSNSLMLPFIPKSTRSLGRCGFRKVRTGFPVISGQGFH